MLNKGALKGSSESLSFFENDVVETSPRAILPKHHEFLVLIEGDSDKPIHVAVGEVPKLNDSACQVFYASMIRAGSLPGSGV